MMRRVKSGIASNCDSLHSRFSPLQLVNICLISCLIFLLINFILTGIELNYGKSIYSHSHQSHQPFLAQRGGDRDSEVPTTDESRSLSDLFYNRIAVFYLLASPILQILRDLLSNTSCEHELIRSLIGPVFALPLTGRRRALSLHNAYQLNFEIKLPRNYLKDKCLE